MKGNTLKEFTDDLLTMGGPEKEFLYRNRNYFLETIVDEQSGKHIMKIFECNESSDTVYECEGASLYECVKKLENAKIFDGKTISQAEREIEVIYG